MVLLALHDRCALELARFGDDRLGADEERRHDDLVAEHEVVDDQVVAVDLPAPGLVGGGLAHHGDPVEPLVVLGEVAAVQLAQGAVEVHDVAAQPESVRAERRAHQAEGGLPLGVVHLVEADALAHVEVLVHPLAPLVVVDREGGPGALVLGQRCQERLCGHADRRGRHAGRLDSVQALLDAGAAVDSDVRVVGEAGVHLPAALPHPVGAVAGPLGEGGGSGQEDEGRREGVTKHGPRIVAADGAGAGAPDAGQKAGAPSRLS